MAAPVVEAAHMIMVVPLTQCPVVQELLAKAITGDLVEFTPTAAAVAAAVPVKLETMLSTQASPAMEAMDFLLT